VAFFRYGVCIGAMNSPLGSGASRPGCLRGRLARDGFWARRPQAAGGTPAPL